jgi:hypothetical protein
LACSHYRTIWKKLLGCPVDLGTPESLKPRLRERVMGELIRVAWGLAGTNPGYPGGNRRNPEFHSWDGF